MPEIGTENRARRRAQAKKMMVVASALTTAAVLTTGAAAPSADLAIAQQQSVEVHAAQVQLASVASALSEVIRGYAEGKPPAEFPAELTALLPGLNKVGPQLLAALGSDQITDFIKSLSLVSLIDQLGIALGDQTGFSLGDLLGGGALNLDGFGLNVITSGPPFLALHTIGLDLGSYTPAFPNQIADEINGTEYLTVPGIPLPAAASNALVIAGLTQALQQQYGYSYTTALARAVVICTKVSCKPGPITTPASDLRMPMTIGWGLGALATGMAYQQVADDLKNQPGGTANADDSTRSLTLLTSILLQNPGRANGGIAARFAPYLKLIGIDPVTADPGVTHDGDATLVPIKVDATVEYDPFSDFAAWANPFTLANNVAAGLFPTYILRGSETDPLSMLTGVFTPVLPALVSNAAIGAIPSSFGSFYVAPASIPISFFPPNTQTYPGFTVDLPNPAGALLGDYAALNTYLTYRQDSLPLLEPARLPLDVVNVLFGTNFSNPFADASEEALTSLVALGYTDVVRNSDGTYTRTLDQAGLNANTGGVPFGTLPQGIDWKLVPEDIVHSLVRGIEQEFFSGGIPGVKDPTTNPQPNPLVTLASLVGLGSLVQGGLINNLPQLTEGLGSLPGLPSITSTGLGNPGVQSLTFSPEDTQRLLGGQQQLGGSPSANSFKEATDTDDPDPLDGTEGVANGTGNQQLSLPGTSGDNQTQSLVKTKLTDQGVHKTPIKDALKKARADMKAKAKENRAAVKKVVTKIKSDIKKALKPKAKASSSAPSNSNSE